MVSSLFAIATAVWFYITAREIRKNAWIWAAFGFVCFQGSFTIFTKFIILPVSLFTPSIHGDSLLNSFIWILVTALSCVFVMFIRTNVLKGNIVAKDSTQ